MSDPELLKRVKAFAVELLSDKQLEGYAFHNLRHTKEVADAAAHIGDASRLTPDQLNTVLISAWLHDISYSKGPDGHERDSANEAAHLLTQWGASNAKIADVERTILSTAMPQNPFDVLGEVLCDADLAHLAGDKVDECGKNLRKEFSKFSGMEFKDDYEWLKFNLKFLKRHRYFTTFGKTVLQMGKEKNIKKMKKALKIARKDRETADEEGSDLRKKLKRVSRSGRGISTMFKISSENHIALSEMADNKANIMISTNTIVLSVIVTLLFNKLDQLHGLVIPTIMLVVTCLSTIVLAILATLPRIASGTFTHEDVKQKSINLLFFGNFHKMELAQYEWGVREMIKDDEFLYASMIKDVYYLGKVLAHKYRYLRLSYHIFMFGFVASVLVFLAVLLKTDTNGLNFLYNF